MRTGWLFSSGRYHPVRYNVSGTPLTKNCTLDPARKTTATCANCPTGTAAVDDQKAIAPTHWPYSKPSVNRPLP